MQHWQRLSLNLITKLHSDSLLLNFFLANIINNLTRFYHFSAAQAMLTLTWPATKVRLTNSLPEWRTNSLCPKRSPDNWPRCRDTDFPSNRSDGSKREVCQGQEDSRVDSSLNLITRIDELITRTRVPFLYNYLYIYFILELINNSERIEYRIYTIKNI